MNTEDGYILPKPPRGSLPLPVEDPNKPPQAREQPQSSNTNQTEFETSFSAGDDRPSPGSNNNNSVQSLSHPSSLPLNPGNGMIWMPFPQGQLVTNSFQSLQNRGVLNGSGVGIPVSTQDPSSNNISQTNQGFVVPIPSNLLTPVSPSSSSTFLPSQHRISQAGHIYEELPGYSAPAAPSVTGIPTNKTPIPTQTTHNLARRRENPLYDCNEEGDEQVPSQSQSTKAASPEEQALITKHQKSSRRTSVCCYCSVTLAIIISLSVSVFALLVAFGIIPLSFGLTKLISSPAALTSHDSSVNLTVQDLANHLKQLNETVYRLNDQLEVQKVNYESQLNSLQANLDSTKHCEFQTISKLYSQYQPYFYTQWIPSNADQQKGSFIRSAFCEGNNFVEGFHLDANLTDSANPKFRCNCSRSNTSTENESECLLKFWICHLPQS